MRKLLVVYNTCGLSRRPNIGSYLQSLQSILNQDFEDFEVAISACMNDPSDIQLLKSQLQDAISYNEIREIVPVNVSFNHTVLKCVEKYGEFEGYIYIDSGVSFDNQTDALSKLYDLYQSGPYGIVVSRVDRDSGFETWFNSSDYGEDLFADGSHLEIPVGKCVNLHSQIFHNEMLTAYGRIVPDIFAGQCTESVFSFLCAALGKKFIVHKDVILRHETAMDGASIGFSPYGWETQGRKKFDHPFGTSESIVDIVNRGAEFGMGYEELQGILMHDKEKFDENGFSLDSRLKDYIRDNLFLREDQFSYNNIDHAFV